AQPHLRAIRSGRRRNVIAPEAGRLAKAAPSWTIARVVTVATVPRGRRPASRLAPPPVRVRPAAVTLTSPARRTGFVSKFRGSIWAELSRQLLEDGKARLDPSEPGAGTAGSGQATGASGQRFEGEHVLEVPKPLGG